MVGFDRTPVDEAARDELLRRDDAPYGVAARENNAAVIYFGLCLQRGRNQPGTRSKCATACGAPVGFDSLLQDGPALSANAFHISKLS